MKKTIILLLVVSLITEFTSKAQVATVSMSTDGTGKTRTFFAGKIDVNDDFQAFENSLFILTPIQPLKKGDVVAATLSEDQGWSANTVADRFGHEGVIEPTPDNKAAMLSGYPVVALVKCSDGNVYIIYPAILKVKINIAFGKELNSDGYQITVSRSVNAGESIPVLFVNNCILSIEAADGKPWFTAYNDNSNPIERAALEAWQLVKNHASTYSKPYYFQTTNAQASNDRKLVTSEDYYISGNSKFILGHYADAIVDYTLAISLDQKYTAAYVQRSEAKSLLCRYAEAIDDCNKVIALNPKDADAYKSRSEAKLSLRHSTDAIADCDQAIALDPKYIAVYLVRGYAKNDLGRYADAIIDFNKAIDLSPKLADAYNYRGYAYYKLGGTKGNYRKAISDYDKSIQFGGGSYKPDFQYRGCAVGAIKKTIAFGPKLAASYSNDGTLNLSSGHYEDAIADYDQAIILNIQDPDTYNGQGYAYYKLGNTKANYREAIANYYEAIELGGSVYKPKYQYIDDALAAIENASGR